jgi:hypothetical protein
VSAERPAKGRSLSRRQFDDVVRRASELAAHEAEQGEGELTEAEVYRIAHEVGLGEQYVRRALLEVRTQSPNPDLFDRVLGPGLVRASRVVPGRPAVLGTRLDQFLVGGRLLQRVRRSDAFMQYRPSVDWISQIARAASATSKKYFVASARSVEVHLEAVDEEHTLVELVVDPAIRGDYVVGVSLGGGAAALGGGVGAGVAVALVAPLVLAVGGGALVAGAITAGAIRIAGRAHRRKLLDVQAEVEGILDRLEAEDPLDPPPPSWRRWVERHFHGARRLLDPREGEDPFDDVPGGL